MKTDGEGCGQHTHRMQAGRTHRVHCLRPPLPMPKTITHAAVGAGSVLCAHRGRGRDATTAHRTTHRVDWVVLGVEHGVGGVDGVVRMRMAGGRGCGGGWRGESALGWGSYCCVIGLAWGWMATAGIVSYIIEL